MAFFGPPSPFVGATTTDAGVSGLVPAPASGRNYRYLNSDSTFSEPLPLPRYKNTTEIIGSMIGGGTATVYTALSPNINVRIFTLIQAPVDGDIDQLAGRTSSAPSPAYNVHIGLWLVGNNGEPSTLVVGQTGSTGTAITTDFVFSISPTNIKAGLYYMSITPDATGTVNTIRAQSAASSNVWRRCLGCSNLESNGNTFFYTCGTSYSQSNHETFSLSNTASPLVGFGYA